MELEAEREERKKLEAELQITRMQLQAVERHLQRGGAAAAAAARPQQGTLQPDPASLMPALRSAPSSHPQVFIM